MALPRPLLVILGALLTAGGAFGVEKTKVLTSLSARPPAAHGSPADSSAASAASAAAMRADGQVVAEPGAHVKLAAEVSGTIARVHVARGAAVKKGQPLVDFDRRAQMAALEEAWAETGEARARLKARQDEQQRNERLVTSGALAANEAKQSVQEKAAARARLAASSAALKRMSALAEKMRLVAPIDGVVIARNVEEGEVVAPGTILFEIVDVKRLRVRAELDEFYLGRVAIGAHVDVRAEAYPERTWRGEVVELGDAVVPRGLRPLDPARPLDVGVLPVFVALPVEHPLKLGQRVELFVAPARDGEPQRVAGAP
jgi:multidrug efflux pump subunit AcrA (membrane-fusion protein)